MLPNQFFYTLKPLIPRPLQIVLRQLRTKSLRNKFADTWPIDSNSVYAPPGWPGWPDGKKFAFVLTHDVDTKRGCRNTVNHGTKIYSVYHFKGKNASDMGTKDRLDCRTWWNGSA